MTYFTEKEKNYAVSTHYNQSFKKQFELILTSTFSACQTIYSGLVAGAKQGNVGKVASCMSCASDFIPVGSKAVKLVGMGLSEVDRRQQFKAIETFTNVASNPTEMSEIAEAVVIKVLNMRLDCLLESPKYTTPQELTRFGCPTGVCEVILNNKMEIQEYISGNAREIENLAKKHAAIVVKEVVYNIFNCVEYFNKDTREKIDNMVLQIKGLFINFLKKDRAESVAEMIAKIVHEKSEGKWKEDPAQEEKFIAHVKAAIESGNTKFDLDTFLESEHHSRFFCMQRLESHFVAEKLGLENPFELELAGASGALVVDDGVY